ncbi:DUF1919 domain-containing protein [Pseudoflavonifractor sp. SW1122]|uniref:DUF1919 domain-containing protein n=1 Tax=Pseudoflavonifractor sp. SW1122 TaxID=2530044 RepID=UPI00143A170B|nr:DUF1919 domain-containing protein [Pseudoflavonifractor sp. SW1122]
MRWNRLVRKIWVDPRNRRRLRNREFTILCNNCNAGVITHDLGQQFCSPTVNLFFYEDHFLRFCENLEYYLAQELVECKNPSYVPDVEYPICNLGDLELHFLHYKSFDEAYDTWNRRKRRINRENIFVMWTFLGGTDIKLMERFDKLSFKNKVAFTEKEFHRVSSAFCIKGYPEGLGVLTLFDNLFGRRVIDQFDYVSWLNDGTLKRM